MAPSAVPQIRFMFKDGSHFEFPVSSFLKAEQLVAVYKKHLDRYESVKHIYYYPTITFNKTSINSYQVRYLKFVKETNTMVASFNKGAAMSIICNRDEFNNFSNKLLVGLKNNDSPIIC